MVLFKGFIHVQVVVFKSHITYKLFLCLTNNADEKDVVGRMPLFEFYALSYLVNYPSRCGLTAYPGAMPKGGKI